MPLYQGLVDAWDRSSPPENCPNGAPPEVLRQIREIDPHLYVRWDGKYKRIALFRNPPCGGHPVLQCFPPFKDRLDGRLVEWLLQADKARRDNHEETDDEWVARIEKRKSQEFRSRLGRRVDHEKLHFGYLKKQTEADGMPRGLFAQVHANTPVGA